MTTTRHRQLLPAPMPPSPTDALRSHFTAVITKRRLLADMSFMSVYPSVSLMIERIGHSAVLDAAAMCACHKSQPKDGLVQSCRGASYWRPVYVDALRALQTAMVDSRLAGATETLAGALLLQTMEHHDDSGGTAWVSHARGLVRLIQHRGPTGFTTDLDLAILQAQAGHIIFGAIMRGEDCYLNTPAWMRFFDGLGAMGAGSSFAAEMQVVRLYAPWPDLLNGYCKVIMGQVKPESSSSMGSSPHADVGSGSGDSPATNTSGLLEEESRIAELTKLLNDLLKHRARLIEWTNDNTPRANPGRRQRNSQNNSSTQDTAGDETVPLKMGFKAALAQCLIFLDCMAARALDELPSFMLLDASLLPDTFYRSTTVQPLSSSAQALLIDEAWDALADVKTQLRTLRETYQQSYFATQKAMRCTMDRIWPFHKPMRAAAAIHEMADMLGYYRAPYLAPEEMVIADTAVPRRPPACRAAST